MSELAQALQNLKKSPLPGLKLMLMGPTGTGKTTSIRSWIRAGVNVAAIFTEPSFEVVGDVPCPQLHWKYISPISVGWDEMLDAADKINKLNIKGLANLDDVNKTKYREFITVRISVALIIGALLGAWCWTLYRALTSWL
jgi:AAA domain